MRLRRRVVVTRADVGVRFFVLLHSPERTNGGVTTVGETGAIRVDVLSELAFYQVL